MRLKVLQKKTSLKLFLISIIGLNIRKLQYLVFGARTTRHGFSRIEIVTHSNSKY